MSTQIPDGYELLVGRSTENAIQAIATAEGRGFSAETVLTQRDGYLIPLDADSIESTDLDGEPYEVETIGIPKANASKAEQEAFAEKHGIDLSATTNAETRAAAIQGWVDAQPEAKSETADDEKGN